MSQPDLEELPSISRRIRGHILRMSAQARASHVGSALSCVDILVSLYFRCARVSPERQHDPARDRVILSKGHASAALYACLAVRGYIPEAQLASFCANGSALQEHPARALVPGVEVSTGSLGHGLGVGAGLALAARLRKLPSTVIAVLSDGECNEGSVWEAALWAPAHNLKNLVAIVDYNKLQACGKSTEITQLEPLAGKWSAFGWDTVEVDGHDFGQLVGALEAPPRDVPRAIIAHTVKGKGVSFMEGNLEWHYRPPSQDDLRLALEELEETHEGCLL